MSIVIAEDVPFQREYLRALMSENFADAGAVFETDNGERALELVREHHPQLVVLDIKLKGNSGVKAAKQIWEEFPLARIIFWSQFKDEIYVRELAKVVPPETVYGYVLKSSADDRLVAALRAVLVEEQCWIDSAGPVARHEQALGPHRCRIRSADRHRSRADRQGHRAAPVLERARRPESASRVVRQARSRSGPGDRRTLGKHLQSAFSRDFTRNPARTHQCGRGSA
jgi:DNA-binding NarL/FixJ family response regulator